MPILGSRAAGAATAFGLTSGGFALDVDYLVVAGGGAGGNSPGGGGGGGGYRTSFPGGTKLTLTETVTTITVGAGGAARSQGQPGTISNRGENSEIGTFSSTGGGLGNNRNVPDFPDIADDPASGGSSGGTPHRGSTTGQANIGGYSPPEGNQGGASGDAQFQASGGGGASQAGQPATGGQNGPKGNGGDGSTNTIEGSSNSYSGGGGGGGYFSAPGGSGGLGGGGDGTNPQGGNGQPGSTNKGGGGGGSGYQPSGATGGSNGGSGKVVIRVAAADAPGSLAVAPGTNTLTTDGPTGDKICVFTVDGTITLE